MKLDQRIAQARASRDYNSLVAELPYARLIGLQCLALGNELIFELPSRQSNMGNPLLPALHGGVIGGFMESAAQLFVLLTQDTAALPKTVDFTIDYLRPGRMQSTFALCNLVRRGRKIANVSVTAWQHEHRQPIATARAHFLLA